MCYVRVVIVLHIKSIYSMVSTCLNSPDEPSTRFHFEDLVLQFRVIFGTDGRLICVAVREGVGGGGGGGGGGLQGPTFSSRLV